MDLTVNANVPAPADPQQPLPSQEPAKKKKAEKKIKTPKAGSPLWAFFWQDFRNQILFKCDDVADVLGVVSAQSWNKDLHDRWGVETLRLVDPWIVIKELEEAGLSNAPKKCRELLEKVREELKQETGIEVKPEEEKLDLTDEDIPF
jgi:hypothetical protein